MLLVNIFTEKHRKSDLKSNLIRIQVWEVVSTALISSEIKTLKDKTGDNLNFFFLFSTTQRSKLTELVHLNTL